METISPTQVVERMRFWKKQKDVMCNNFSEKGVLAGTHCPNIVLANGRGFMLDWPGDHEEAVKVQQRLFPPSATQLSLF